MSDVRYQITRLRINFYLISVYLKTDPPFGGLRSVNLRMLEIIPAILTNDPKELEEKLRLAESVAQRVQIDIVDGLFANNRTVSLETVANIDTNLLLDIQLMTKEPADWVERAVRAMADRVIGHIEMMTNQTQFIEKVAETGEKVGLAIDLSTPVSALDPAVLNNLDVVLIMAVKAGFGGQDFQEPALEKVTELLSYRANNNCKYRICVDGGINEENIQRVRQAGADEAVIGHSLFEGDIQERLEGLRRAAYK